MRRYDPGYADLKARLDAGAIGAPLLVHCAHRNPSVHDFFDSQMIITDTAVHEVDVTRWLLGEEIVARDRAHARADAAGRARACATRSCCCSRPSAGGSSTSRRSSAPGTRYDIRCEVVGEDGTLELLPPATVALRTGPHGVARDPAGLPSSASAPPT